jgi:hypothetical protein
MTEVAVEMLQEEAGCLRVRAEIELKDAEKKEQEALNHRGHAEELIAQADDLEDAIRILQAKRGA